MLDIKFIRENPKTIKDDLKKRRDLEKVKWVDDLFKKEKEHRELLFKTEQLRHRRNVVSDEIRKLKEEGKAIKEKIKEAKEIPEKIKKGEERIKELKEKIHFYLMRLPNIMHKSVPYGKDETGNKVVRTWGEKPRFDFKLKPHGELVEELGVANFEKAAEVSGRGFNYITGELALLEQALQRFAIDFLVKKGFSLVIPPNVLKRKPYEGVVSLEDFENVMYKIEGEDLYLIATSEHPMAALYMGEVLKGEQLPIKLCGVSSCYRKEIGGHGIDTKGFFRMHQFNKIEQFIFCKPQDSWKFHEEIQKNAEEIYKKIGIPFRVVNVCTGDLGILAAKKYDIEAWFPRQNKYAEVGSNSNCTDYQARRLNIRYEKNGKREHVHTLNNTGIATSRAMVAILENFQQKDGSVKIPKVLQKYMNGIKIIKKRQ